MGRGFRPQDTLNARRRGCESGVRQTVLGKRNPSAIPLALPAPDRRPDGAHEIVGVVETPLHQHLLEEPAMYFLPSRNGPAAGTIPTTTSTKTSPCTGALVIQTGHPSPA